MCSVQEEDIEGAPAKLEHKVSREGRICMKCSSNPAVVVVRMNDPLCKSCFLAYFTHKFRATIGKARVVRPGERVLLAFSGGPSSSALLRLVEEGFCEHAAKKLKFEPGIAFIDEGEVLKQHGEERSRVLQEIQDAVSKTQFPFHLLSLEDVFEELPSQDDAMCCKNLELNDKTQRAAKLTGLFDSMSSMTAKQDLLKTLRRQLLLMTARREGYTKIMLAECATRLSVRLLSDIAQGRGGDLPYDTGFSDDRHGDVIFLRPMREFMSKEIVLYNFFNGVETVQVPTFGTMSQSHASIDRLTEQFVSGLQAQQPFTVSTIFRTGDKLSIKESCKDIATCVLCGAPMNTDPEVLSSLREILSSVQLDAVSDETSQSGGDCCGGCDSGCSSLLTEQLSKDSVMKALCYGCCLTFKDGNFTISNLPPFVVEKAKKAHHRAQMKEQIKDFLLDD